MINLVDQDASAHAEPRCHADPANQQIPSGQVSNVETLRSMRLERLATLPAGRADTRALEAYVERRRRLAAQIRLENPSRSEEEIEARLEQFGA
jgi:hypothetical protein